MRNYIRDSGCIFSNFHILTSEDIDDVISRFYTDVVQSLPNASRKMASNRFVKFAEADIKSFTEEQENVNKKKKTHKGLL